MQQVISEGGPPPPPSQPVPRIVVTQHFDPFPFATFEYLANVATFVMTRTGAATAKVSTPSDVDLFNCEFSQSTYWEGCQPESLEKQIRIYERGNSKLVMQLSYATPPCHSCFEEVQSRTFLN